MKQASQFVVNPGWKILLSDMGVNTSEILLHAGLSADLFSRKGATLSVEEYFDMWQVVDQAVGERELPLLIGQSISVEVFEPPIFASFCSPNLNIALQRLSQYKRLIGPMVLKVDISESRTSASLECYQFEGEIPHCIGTAEAVFLTTLARMATRQQIRPLEVILTRTPDNVAPYEEFFGCPIRQGSFSQVSFTSQDAVYPFVSDNPVMWECFEPELKRRLSELDMEATLTQQVKSVLLEMLPSGMSSMDKVAGRLAMSKRTLQRKLSDEGETFQTVLKKTREELAQHYLANSSMSQSEISFLLGFQDTNSFIRAYSNWTGQPPGQYRSMH
ncbi:AraC family transcriptional regulator [Hahella sp. CCB-MM4]|uniref:AraC family transcriptional regulator n=1 Tax=Hahella sp. (strain CCB-MM4) TaxID=1926491 RepID=UPI000B9C6D9B|nr:AraC family transcriptional regulator [Hahella sp. CCB-MM4]OZG74129.1 AraC family transcriptional regulator [Hahella sp. CCB-MM4]